MNAHRTRAPVPAAIQTAASRDRSMVSLDLVVAGCALVGALLLSFLR